MNCVVLYFIHTFSPNHSCIFADFTIPQQSLVHFMTCLPNCETSVRSPRARPVKLIFTIFFFHSKFAYRHASGRGLTLHFKVYVYLGGKVLSVVICQNFKGFLVCIADLQIMTPFLNM